MFQMRVSEICVVCVGIGQQKLQIMMPIRNIENRNVLQWRSQRYDHSGRRQPAGFDED